MTDLLTFLAMLLHVPACETEDSTACYWNAASQGNGVGSSFLSLTDTVRIVVS
jgi:hypothetical protein